MLTGMFMLTGMVSDTVLLATGSLAHKHFQVMSRTRLAPVP